MATLALAGAARRGAWRRPEWPWVALVVAAWAALIAGAAAGPRAPASARGALMVVAMMLPATIPVARAISFDSMWDRRYRSPALFVAALPRRVGRVRRRRARRSGRSPALLGAGHALHGARRDRRDPARRRELAALADATAAA